MDCSERSKLPVSRINDSATTTIPSAAENCAVFEKFAVVKNAGLVKIPTTKSTAIAGTRASPRTQPKKARRLGGLSVSTCSIAASVTPPRPFPLQRR
jgi:hypothetical protein